MLRVPACFRSLALGLLSACGLIVALAGAPAQAASLFQKQIYMSGANYDGDLPGCDAALDKIASRFAHKESRVWNSSLQILGFEKVRQTAFSPWAQQTIPRRFNTSRQLSVKRTSRPRTGSPSNRNLCSSLIR